MFSRNTLFQESIKRRKKAFEDRAKEIEAQLAADADRERRWLESDPHDASTVSDDRGTGSSSVASAMSAGHAKLVAKNRRPSHANDKDIGEVHQHDQKYNQNHGKCCSNIRYIPISCQPPTYQTLQRFIPSLSIDWPYKII